VDGLEPHPQGKVAILENRALAHGKGGAQPKRFPGRFSLLPPILVPSSARLRTA
jgi:hypothetical protein